MQRFIAWDRLEVKFDGAKLATLVRERALVPPIERIDLRFSDGLLRVEGAMRKFISVPFAVEVREIVADGDVIRVPLSSASAFGGIPIPQFLFGLVKGRLPAELVRLEPPATLVLSLDRFLPTFVDADIREIRIIDGGLAVALGAGGADLPP
ncbi:MAG TPA: hypothetical protein VJZ76_02820 [Thermoanaerobaculia bacterium]|nr:hypothetical protein [Thermoanaerobaculia bacterium]